MNEKVTQAPPEIAGVDIVVPVYNAAEDVKRCVDSVLQKTSGDYRLTLIDDASTSPDIGELFEHWRHEDVSQRVLLRNETNLGFTGTANRGMSLSRRDIVLLNSDTIVTKDWLAALQRCAYSDERTGTVTPFSNNAEICSYPRFCADNGWPEGKDPEPVREALSRAAVPSYPEIPTGVGFCLYIKRSVIDTIGFFDEAFGAGYGEENDFCLRAKKAGFRNVLCDDAFVVHLGERSFKGRKQALSGRNMSVLLGKHPEYLNEVKQFIALDPLRAIRVAAQLEEDKAEAGAAVQKKAVLHLVHVHGGGTALHIRQLIKDSPAGWRHYFVVVDGAQWRVELVPEGEEAPAVLCVARRDGEPWEAFIGQLCGSLGVHLIHVHNVSGCRDGILSALPALSIPYGYTIHDLSFACPTITFLDARERFCGCPTELTVCQQCLLRQNDFSHIDIAAWREKHREFVQKAAFLIAPSGWAAQVFERYFPGTKAEIVEHGIPRETVPSRHLSALLFAESDWSTVAVLGAVGPDKGARRVETLVALAAARQAEVRFVLIGYLDRQRGPWQSEDGRFLVHGRYEPGDLTTLMDYYKVSLVVYPSAGPETFCYTLSETWRAGRPALVPPFGALADRVKVQGAGWILRDDEWEDEGKMLCRIMALLDPENRAEMQEKTICARRVSLPSIDAMVATTVAHYAKALSPAVSRSIEKASFPAIRIRDGLGYTTWPLSEPASGEAKKGENARWLRWAMRVRKTPAGKILYAMTPRKIIGRLRKYAER